MSDGFENSKVVKYYLLETVCPNTTSRASLTVRITNLRHEIEKRLRAVYQKTQKQHFHHTRWIVGKIKFSQVNFLRLALRLQRSART